MCFLFRLLVYNSFFGLVSTCFYSSLKRFVLGFEPLLSLVFSYRFSLCVESGRDVCERYLLFSGGWSMSFIKIPCQMKEKRRRRWRKHHGTHVPPILWVNARGRHFGFPSSGLFFFFLYFFLTRFVCSAIKALRGTQMANASSNLGQQSVCARELR